ncbi:Major facilitator superfamily domain, general substrate transporter [Penicillium digitatum]|uniref:Major facilitator superfamily domain, general substrate transporter n=1 Tax=Penicillium digitatum TaxID=36651 RepID=A0A7T6XNH6_PENDI|nr:Major facilitator superfamily domain, general substrate transporter [Penicillium digitatum]
MKTRATPRTSTVPIAAPKLVSIPTSNPNLLEALHTKTCYTFQDERTTSVFNVLFVNITNAQMDIHIPTTNIEDEASFSTATNLGDEYAQLLIRKHNDGLENAADDTAMKTKALATNTEISTIHTGDLDTTSTGPTNASKLSVEYAQLPVDQDSLGMSRINSLWMPKTSMTAKKAQVPFIQHDIVVDAEDLHINNGLHDTTYGSVIAFQSDDDDFQHPVSEHEDWCEDAEFHVSVVTEEMPTCNGPLGTTSGSITPDHEDIQFSEDGDWSKGCGE